MYFSRGAAKDDDDDDDDADYDDADVSSAEGEVKMPVKCLSVASICCR